MGMAGYITRQAMLARNQIGQAQYDAWTRFDDVVDVSRGGIRAFDRPS
jgi:hypothetical protein